MSCFGLAKTSYTKIAQKLVELQRLLFFTSVTQSNACDGDLITRLRQTVQDMEVVSLTPSSLET